MREGLARWRAGSMLRGWLAAFVLAAALPPALVAGQERPDTVPRDTVPRDTVPRPDTVRVPIPPAEVAPDTLPADSAAAADSVLVVPVFPRFPQPMPVGWAFARWEWGREELRRFHAPSLLHLLQQIPGLTTTQAGDFGVPAGLSALGLGGARVRVFLDGFELDPLGFTTPDLQQIGLIDLESVRVERGLSGIRIYLDTFRMPGGNPVSAVEAATGVYDAKLLRALFARGVGTRSILTAGYDLVATSGFAFRTPFSFNSARASWSYALSEETGLQLEYRTEAVESTAEALLLAANRQILLLRGRSELRPGLIVDGMLGRIWRRPEAADPLDVTLASTQAAARAGYDLGSGWVEGALRFRSASAAALAAPGLELSARGAVRPLERLTVESEVRSGAVAGEGGLEWSGTVRAEPAAGLAAFATLSTGERALGLVRDTTLTLAGGGETPGDSTRVEPRFSAVSTSAGGVRLGAEWAGGGALLGVAAVSLAEGRAVPFGLAFDRALGAVEVGAARGFEALALLPVPFTRNLVRLEGSFAVWPERGGRPYLPEQQGRLALIAHGRFYDGQLEPTLRLEGLHRGATLGPDPAGAAFDRETAPYNLANLFLQIRIIEVHAFLLYENLFNVRTASDLPGLPLPGTRFMYGVRWTFQN